MKIPDFDDVKRKVDIALECLYANDVFLITNDSSEWSITHKFAEYLQVLFREWNVDCEYNRLGDGQKPTSEHNTTKPDIIIHMRNEENITNNKENLLVVEAKKDKSPSKKNSKKIDKNDRIKIENYVEKGNYEYCYGLWICFYQDKSKPCQIWAKNDKGKCEWFM